MKIYHFTQAAVAFRSGLYETSKQLCTAFLKMGIDYKLVMDSYPDGGAIDRGIVSASESDALKNADIVILSSRFPEAIYKSKRKNLKKIFILHGMIEAVVAQEMASQSRVLSTCIQYLKSPFFDAYITFWKRHLPWWASYSDVSKRQKIFFVEGGIDLNVFHENNPPVTLDGNPKCLMATLWRGPEKPSHMQPLWLSELREEKLPNLRLHCYGIGAQRALSWKMVMEPYISNGTIGTFASIVNNMNNVYTGVDLTIESSPDCSRVYKESMASGVPVVCHTNDYDDYVPKRWQYIPSSGESFKKAVLNVYDDLQKDRQKVKEFCVSQAKKYFDINSTAKEMLKIFEKIISGDI